MTATTTATTTRTTAARRKPADRLPKKTKTVTATVRGVRVEVDVDVFDSPLLLDLLSLDEDEADEEDVRAAVRFTRSIVGKTAYRAILTAIAREGGGIADAANVLGELLDAVAPQIEALGKS